MMQVLVKTDWQEMDLKANTSKLKVEITLPTQQITA